LSGFESVSDIAFSADGKSLAALTDPRFGQRLDITVWNPTTGRKELSIAVGGDGFPLVFGPLAFSPGGKLLAYSYSNHFGYRTGKVEFRVTGKLKANRRVELGSEVCAMSWKQKGAVLACGCWDGTINLLDAESAKITQTLKGHTEPVRALAFSDSGTLVSADAKGGVRMSELKSGKQVIRHEPPKGNVRCVALTEDGKLVAFGLEGGEIIVSEIPRSEKDVRKK
jgi:WD40 repeat protein